MLANITFLLKLVEGGAYRGPADVKPLGEISFYDPGPGRELAVHDEFPKLLERGENAGPVNEFGSSGLRLVFSSGRGHRKIFSVEAGLTLDCTINNCAVAIPAKTA
jgi:hypothetical protein